MDGFYAEVVTCCLRFFFQHTSSLPLSQHASFLCGPSNRPLNEWDFSWWKSLALVCKDLLHVLQIYCFPLALHAPCVCAFLERGQLYSCKNETIGAFEWDHMNLHLLTSPSFNSEAPENWVPLRKTETPPARTGASELEACLWAVS